MAARLSSTLLRTQADRRLVALAAQGSEPAFEALVERYRRPLQSYCRRLLLPAEAAEDVVQQAFISTWQALRGGTEVHDARAWLYRVTHNAAINALKRSGYDHDQLDEALHGAEAPEEDLERRTAIRRTLAGLAALPEMQREALLRTAVEGHSHEDVARALGLTDGAVRGLVYRARATLREAATALTPAPAVQWAAAAGGAPNAPIAERVAEIVAGAGSAGAGAVLLKGGATVLTAGALAGGVAVVDKERSDAQPDRARTEQRVPAVASAVAAQAGDAEQARGRDRSRGRSVLARARREERRGRRGGDERRGRRGGGGDRRRDGGGDRRGSSGPGPDDDDGRRDDDRSGSGSSGPGSGDDDSRSGPSGSGSGGSDDDRSRSGSSGSGGSDDDSRSGSSGSGSGATDDDSGSGSTSSGSGSGSDDDSGSTSSGSGSGDAAVDDDNSGSGSSSSGSGDGLRSGPSGSDDPLDEN